MGLQVLRGFQEIGEKMPRERVRVFGVRRKTVGGTGEWQLRQADIQTGASGFDLGSKASDVERRIGDGDGESGSFGKLLGELKEGDDVALSHVREHNHMVLGAQILRREGSGRIHCG